MRAPKPCLAQPPADGAAEGLWRHIKRGTLDIISSDHSGFCHDGDRGKRLHGDNVPFTEIPNGVPGVGARLPVLFSEGVATGRLTPSQFAGLTAFNPARLYGLHGKGRIAPGADADLVLWDPERRVTLTNALMQHAIDYTPYGGMRITGWPTLTLRRGEVVMQEDRVLAAAGSGKFLSVAPHDFIKPNNTPPNGFNAAAHI